jgi:transposase
MRVVLHHQDDRRQMETLVRAERNALQRDRLRCVLLALDGKQAREIASVLGRSRRFVQEWVYAYRDGGVEAVRPRPPGRRPPKLPREQEQAFRRRMLDGPAPADGGVCTLRAVDARRILEQEFGVGYTLQGVYDLLHRLNLSCLVPRPRHRKNDPQAMQRWIEAAPLLSSR